MSTIKAKLKKPKAALPMDALEKNVKVFAGSLRKRWAMFLVAAATKIKTQQSQVLRALDDFDPESIFEVLDELRVDLLEKPAKQSIEKHCLLPFDTGRALAKRGENDGDFFAVLTEKPPKPSLADKTAWSYARARIYSDVRSRDDAQMSTFRTVLLEDLQEGKPPRETAKRTAELLDEKSGEWESIARTESARALNEGLFATAAQLGKRYVYVPEQPSACTHCKRLLTGRVFPAESLKAASNVGKKQRDWVAALPMHPNCTCAPIPASRWTQEQAEETVEGNIPPEGVKIEYLPPSKRK